MSKKQKGYSVFTDEEISALAKAMIFPEEGVGLYLDMINQKVKDQSTKVSDVIKEAKLAPTEEETTEFENYEEPVENKFFDPEVPQDIEETPVEEVTPVINEIKSTEEELALRNLSDLSKDLFSDEKNLANFITNYDFLKNEGIDLDIKKLEKTFAPLAIIEPKLLEQSYGTLLANGYSIVKPNGNLALNILLIEPTELEMKFSSLRNVDADDFYKLYPEMLVEDANDFAYRINYCQTNGIEYKTKVNDRDVYLPIILSKKEFESIGGTA